MTATAPHQQTNIHAFDERDEAYEFEYAGFRIRQICSLLKALPRKDTVADLGCFSGIAAPHYAQTGIRTLHGFDISENSMAKMRSKGFETFYWNMEGGECPQPPDTYDVVVAAEVFEHVVDTDKLANEIQRILKPGGTLIFSTPNLASWYNRCRLLCGKAPTCYPGASSTIRRSRHIDLNHIRVNVLSEWISFLEKHGFCVGKTLGTSHLQHRFGGLRSRLIAWVDRVAMLKPSWSVGLILVATKPAS